MPTKGQLVADHFGKRFGMLLALSLAGRDKHRHAVWRFRCDCGNERDFVMNQVLAERGARCCGCSTSSWARSETADAFGVCDPVWLAKLRGQLSYDEETGKLTWLVNRKSARIGKTAGVLSKERGYIYVGFLGALYSAHRLIWAHIHGKWPQGEIDHMNGIRTDNRIANLRDVTRSINQQNMRKAASNSTVGLLGVSAMADGRFFARIQAPGAKRMTRLGTFPTAEEAYAAYVKAKREIHPGGTL